MNNVLGQYLLSVVWPKRAPPSIRSSVERKKIPINYQFSSRPRCDPFSLLFGRNLCMNKLPPPHTSYTHIQMCLSECPTTCINEQNKVLHSICPAKHSIVCSSRQHSLPNKLMSERESICGCPSSGPCPLTCGSHFLTSGISIILPSIVGVKVTGPCENRNKRLPVTRNGPVRS